MSAALYLRASQDREGDELAVSRQRADGIDLINRRGWQLDEPHTYVDNDTSASGRKPRPEFERMLGDIEAGQIKVVVAWALDRLTRNRRETVRLIETCQEYKVIVALVRGSDIDMTTPTGRMVAGILAEVAANEIETKGDRRRRAALQAAESGKRWPHARAFGFEIDGVTVRPDEAAAIRQACDDLLAGASMVQVFRDMNAAGHLTPFGNEWTHTGTVRMLIRPRNAGLREYHGEIMGKAEWPAIVPEPTWRAVVALLTDPARRIAPPAAKLLLSGIASCPCGDQFHGGRSARGYQNYRCARRAGHDGPHVTVKAAPVNEFIDSLIVARLSRRDAARLLVDDKRPDFAKLRSEARVLRARLEEIAAAFGDGELTRAQARVATERARDALAKVEEKMADAGRAHVLGPLVGGVDVQAAWEALDIDRRRSVVTTLFERIVLHSQTQGRKVFDPERVEVEWRKM